MKTIKFWLWVLRAAWRIERGRWHVLRDAPDYVVEQVAVLRHSLTDEDSRAAKTLIAEAKKELELRRHRETKDSK